MIKGNLLETENRVRLGRNLVNIHFAQLKLKNVDRLLARGGKK